MKNKKKEDEEPMHMHKEMRIATERENACSKEIKAILTKYNCRFQLGTFSINIKALPEPKAETK